MFYVYVLRSSVSNKRYVGSTGKSPIARLTEHNSGSNKFTKGHKPFKLIYTEEFASRTEALKREKFLKSGQGRKFLDTIINKGP